MLILFDLDDTLFDHAFAFDAATTALHAAHGSSRAREDFASVGLELGIVTNGELEQQRNKLARCGIEDRFEHVIVPASCGYAKPHAQIFAEACRRFGCRPAEAVYVGDSYALDAQAARAAGLRGVWLDRLRVADASHEGPIIEKLDVLAALLGLGSDA